MNKKRMKKENKTKEWKKMKKGNTISRIPVSVFIYHQPPFLFITPPTPRPTCFKGGGGVPNTELRFLIKTLFAGIQFLPLQCLKTIGFLLASRLK